MSQIPRDDSTWAPVAQVCSSLTTHLSGCIVTLARGHARLIPVVMMAVQSSRAQDCARRKIVQSWRWTLSKTMAGSSVHASASDYTSHIAAGASLLLAQDRFVQRSQFIIFTATIFSYPCNSGSVVRFPPPVQAASS